MYNKKTTIIDINPNLYNNVKNKSNNQIQKQNKWKKHTGKNSMQKKGQIQLAII